MHQSGHTLTTSVQCPSRTFAQAQRMQRREHGTNRREVFWADLVFVDDLKQQL